jgi:putative membrane protein
MLDFRFPIARSVGTSSRLAVRSAQASPAERDKFNAARAGQKLQAFSVCAGTALLAVVWLGPLPGLAREAFFAHMLMHMGVVAVAAPLLAIGVAGGPLDLARDFPRLFAPIPASILELVIVWAWHAPLLHHAARNHVSAFMIEQGMFFAAGLFVWLSAVGGEPLSIARRSAAGVVALLLTAMHMTLLGALLGLSPRPLYQHMQGFSGLTALDDQHLGGAIMLLIGGVSYLFGGLWLTIRLLRSRRAESAEGA